MDDLKALKKRAKELKARIADFLRTYGPDSVPELQQLHHELAQIEERLKALGEYAPDGDAPESDRS
jgi:hypothetical protein